MKKNGIVIKKTGIEVIGVMGVLEKPTKL